jgi:O-antigen/teichoic acid export membrane protein
MRKFIAQVRKRLADSPVHLRLFRGSFWSLLGTAASRVLHMVTTIFIARYLGRELYGSYGMIQSTVGMFGMLSGFSMGRTMTKFTAELKGKDPLRAGRILSLARTLSVLTAAITGALLCFFSPWLAENTLNRPDIAPLLQIGAVLLLVVTLNNVQTGSLAGFEAFKDVARITAVQGIATPLVAIPLVYYYGLTGAVTSLVIVAAVGYVLAGLALRERCRAFDIRQSYFDLSAVAERKVIWSFSIPATISGLLYMPVVWVSNTILVNQANGYGELGLFNAANQWRQMAIVIPNILGSVMLPILSDAYGREDRREFRKALEINLEITWAVALPATVAVIGFSEPLVALFGSQYREALPIMPVLLTTAFLYIVNNVVGTAIVGSGRMWTGSLFNLAWGVVLIVATTVLAPMYGAKGLAHAYLISYLFHSVLQMVYVEKWLAPSAIVGQRKLILFTLITLIPIFFLVKVGRLSYVWNAALALLSLTPLMSMVGSFARGKNSEGK